MTFVLWSIAAVVAAIGFAMVIVRRNQRRLPPIVLAPGESMPTTPLQRLARAALAVSGLFAAAAAATVAYHSPQVFWDRDPVRLAVTGLMLAALGVFAMYQVRVASWTARDDGTLDERDRAIIGSAPSGQAPAMIITLAAWLIGLGEAFHGMDAVPLVFVALMFWSSLLVSVLALLAGVVIGYRRQ
jgi:hypothetical protein